MDRYAEKVGQEQLAGGNKIINSVEKGAADIQKGRSQAFTDPLHGFGNVLKGVSEGAFGTVVGAAESALAPITPAIQKITDVLASGAMKSNPNLKKAYDVILPKINEWAKAHPDAATLTSDIANTLLLAVGGEEGIGTKGVLSKPVSEVASDVVKTTKNVGKAIGEVNPALTPEAAAAMKDYKVKVAGEVDNLATQITQGKTSDIARAKKALSSIDVTGVNSYKDLTATLNKKIESLSETLDKTLETNSKPKTLSELTTSSTVGDKTISHNFVKDAIGQLKDFYKSTNDPIGAEKIAQLEHKALYEGGLDAKDINDLAKLHGQEMSAYNANGQLASGLTKQAAENTRMGLKTTARDMFGNEVYKQADGEIASLIRTRDLSQKMVEAVTKLQSRIQERSWGELIGRQIGKLVNLFTGGGAKGFVEYLTKRGEGTKLLNALDLDRNLNKNLKSLQDILNNKNLPEKTVERKLQEIIDQSSASNQALKPGETLQRNQDIGIESQQNIENPIKISNNTNIDKTIPPDSSFSKGATPETKSLAEVLTKKVYSEDRSALHQKIVEDIYSKGAYTGKDAKGNDVFGGKVNQDKRIDIVIGLPAAGKSSILVNPLSKEYGSLIVDADRVKELMPEFEGGKGASAVHPESSDIAEGKLLIKSMVNGDNVVLPIIGKNPSKVENIINAFHTRGYDVHFSYNHITPEESAMRATSRAKETGRIIPEDYILKDVENKPLGTYNQLKDHPKLKSVTAYNNQVPFGTKPILTAATKESPVISRIAKQALDLTEKNGGVTIKLNGDMPSSGFSVADNKLTEKMIPMEKADYSTVENYIRQNLEKLLESNRHIGLWVEDGKLYMDTPLVLKSKIQALNVARKADQIGIFDLEKFETVFTNKTKK